MRDDAELPPWEGHIISYHTVHTANAVPSTDRQVDATPRHPRHLNVKSRRGHGTPLTLHISSWNFVMRLCSI